MICSSREIKGEVTFYADEYQTVVVRVDVSPEDPNFRISDFIKPGDRTYERVVWRLKLAGYTINNYKHKIIA